MAITMPRGRTIMFFEPREVCVCHFQTSTYIRVNRRSLVSAPLAWGVTFSRHFTGSSFNLHFGTRGIFLKMLKLLPIEYLQSRSRFR